jgi:hypothetical protein
MTTEGMRAFVEWEQRNESSLATGHGPIPAPRSRRNNLIELAIVLAALALALLGLVACGGPSPTPDPVGPPVVDAAPPVDDKFIGRIADCGLRVVEAEWAAASPMTATCLDLDGGVASCLAGLVPAYAADTVACIVRDVGFNAHVEIARGMAGPETQRRAANAREWQRSYGIGYHN